MKKYYFISYVAVDIFGKQQMGNVAFEAAVLPSEAYMQAKIAQSSAYRLIEKNIVIMNMMELPEEDYKSFSGAFQRNKVLNGEKLLSFVYEQAEGSRQTEFRVVLVKGNGCTASDELQIYTTSCDGFPQPSTQYSRAVFLF